MNSAEKPQFISMLTEVLASYAKPLPEAALLRSWWIELEVFPIQVVNLAFTAYRDSQPTYAPHPTAIRKICREYDGRPGAEEAWAIALTSQDESETVVWTQEIAAAFSTCRPVLESSGAISARKTFIEAYSRMVAEARSNHVPANWQYSLGWDGRKREVALTRAANAGLLPAPTIAALLPAPGDGAIAESSPEGLKRVKEEVAKLIPASERARLAKEMQAQAQRDAEAERKRQFAEQVANYGRQPCAEPAK